MNRRFLIVCLAVASVGFCVLGGVFYKRLQAHREFARQAELARQQAQRIRDQVLFTERKIAAGLTFSDSLQRMGLDPLTTAAVARSAQAVFDLRHLRAGNALAIGRSVLGELRAVRYQIDADKMLWIRSRALGFAAEIQLIPSHTEIVGVTGEIHDSLFNAVMEAGESPELALRLADIFGWDLDFYTDPREGDTFRVVVEKKKYLNGQTASYGRILAAEYVNEGRAYRAVLFRDPAGRLAYYAPDGGSLQKAFLRSPLKFGAAITSRFSRGRYHPILKFHRPHLGIDYGAPVGTPVQAIGSGRVVSAGYQGGSGGMVHLRHTNGYETFYLHLSRILAHPGQYVEQGQRIGLVGRSGLATGPHLDFRIRQHGAYRNFETLRLPPAQPVAAKDWSEFVTARDQALALLPETPALQARNADRAASASSQ